MSDDRAVPHIVREKMEETMASGTSIILDRYVYSGVAYSAAKVHYLKLWMASYG